MVDDDKELMKRYPIYKDSGIEWIGQIPSHWNIKRIKYIDKIIMGQSPESTNCNKEGAGIPFLQGNADFSGLNPIPGVWCDHQNKLAQKDDILLSVRAPVGAVNIADKTYGIGRGLCAIRPKYSHKKYSYYRALCLLDELNRIATGSTYTAVAVDQVNNVIVPNSVYDEQEILSNYLDRKTAQIDNLIIKKERMIGLLEEERIAVINLAVTRGINPKAEMKDSGIEWLGDVPEHWEPWKVSHGFGLIGSGTTPPSDQLEWYGGDITWITTGELRENVICDTEKKVTREALNSFSALKLFPRGSLAIAMYGATIGRLGILGVDATTNQACCVLCGGDIFDVKFVFYWLQAFKETIILLATGGGQPNISQDKIKSLKIFCPLVSEQRSITEYLDRETGKIDALIEKVQIAVEKLKEYRTAVISAAVTGKIDIRDEVNA